MNLKYSYWFFKSALPSHFCDELIKYGNSKQELIGLTGGIKLEDKENLKEKELNDLKQKRDSNIVWLNEKWLFRYIHYYVHLANKNSGWNFQWDFSENAQFTKYKLNQFYDWHCDSWKEPYGDNKICDEILPKGSIIVFPSFIYHRVKPVTKGNRYSLVVWNCGKLWK